MTVVHAATGAGGAERVAFDLAISLDRDRFASSFCATKRSPARTREDELVAAGVSYTELDGRSTRNPLGLAALARLLRRERTEIVHSHMWDSNLWAALAKPLARTPVFVAHEHTWSFEGEPFRVATDRFVIARAADIFVCVSEDDRRKMIEVERIPAERIRVLPNGIPDFPAPRGTDVRAELGIAPDAPVVGAIAVLRRQKRLDVLIEAIAHLAQTVPAVQLLLAGTDGGLGLRKELEQHAVDLGVRDRVHFLGLRQDVPDVVAACDVLSLSSDFEGQPLAVLEYMAAGKPIVATSVGGLPELIGDGVDGLLVPRREPVALAAALERVLIDKELAASLGAAARERQQREFSLTAAVGRVEALYDELWSDVVARRAKQQG